MMFPNLSSVKSKVTLESRKGRGSSKPSLPRPERSLKSAFTNNAYFPRWIFTRISTWLSELDGSRLLSTCTLKASYFSISPDNTARSMNLARLYAERNSHEIVPQEHVTFIASHLNRSTIVCYGMCLYNDRLLQAKTAPTMRPSLRELPGQNNPTCP